MFSAGCTMNIGSKKLLREVASTFCGAQEDVRWVHATRDNLQPFAHGIYVNQLGDTSEQLVRSGYGPNYARLVEIKKKYDPNNVLRLNQNINPDSPSNA
jgi:hypothetical protein